MNKYLLAIIAWVLVWDVTEAQVDILSVGPSYTSPIFYSLDDGSTTTFKHTDWDIAFGVSPFSSGIFVNEGVSNSSTNPEGEVELYVTDSTDFATVDTTGMRRIFNNEISWESGAFNQVANAMDPLDLGWGSYSPVNNTVEGTRVFILKLRNGAFKKVKVLKLDAGIYTFQYADLDGRNEVTQTLDKADFKGKTLGYYSFSSESTVDLEPEKWDLLFTRYYTTVPLNDGTGAVLNYVVTGALINQGVEVARANGVDPEAVNQEGYTDQYQDSLDVIGHDWKAFDLNTFQWVIPTDLVYFVKTGSNETWKVQFIDFEGSSTGGFALLKDLESRTTSVVDQARNFKSFELYPNPASDFITTQFELDTRANQGVVRITNAVGQFVQQENIQIQSGLNTLTLPLDIVAGTYFMEVQSGWDLIIKPFVIK